MYECCRPQLSGCVLKVFDYLAFKSIVMMFHHSSVLCLLSLLFYGAIGAQSTCNSTSSKYPILIDATTESLETGLENGLFTSVDLVNAYVARILEVNATLHVVTELNPDALSIAAELDAERANGTTRGPLRM